MKKRSAKHRIRSRRRVKFTAVQRKSTRGRATKAACVPVSITELQVRAMPQLDPFSRDSIRLAMPAASYAFCTEFAVNLGNTTTRIASPPAQSPRIAIGSA
jgi:hypothetical protein